MKTITIKQRKPHPAQLEINRNLTRFNVVDCGRRFGKSSNGEQHVIDTLLAGYPVGLFAPRYKDVSDWWRALRTRVRPAIQDDSVQEKRIALITGGVLEMWSLEDKDAGRSRHYKLVVIDEAAKARHLKIVWQEAIRPTLTDLEGWALFYSTPKGMNYFKTLFDYGNDPARDDWACWQFPTAANPKINPAEIEAARLELPERVFRQEYLAEFIDDANLFRNVVECATSDEIYKAEAGREYVFGVDWGKLNDFTVITVWDTQAARMVHMDRFNQIDYTVQSQRLKALYERFRPHTILAESNSMGEPIIDQLRSEGLPMKGFATTAVSKAMIINQLSLGFEQKSIALLNDPVLIAELQAYEASRLPGGNLRYSAPEGQHDDTVMATAIGLQAVTEGKPQVDYQLANPFYG